MKKYARRVDENQSPIVDALRAIGVGVKITSNAGDGLTDVLLFYRGQTYVGEIKDGEKDASHRQLTPAQIELHDMALQHGVVIPIFTSVDNALLFFGATPQ